MGKYLISISQVFDLTSEIFRMFFSDTDISDIERKSILNDPVDREIYLEKLREIRNSKQNEIYVPLKNHRPFKLYSEVSNLEVNGL